MAAITLTVTMHGGATHDVTPTLEDTLAFESTLRKNRGWGGLEDNALKLMPFRAWNALKRTGKTDLTWQEFSAGEKAALDVSPKKADASDDDADEADGVEEVAGVGKAGRKGRSTGSSSRSQ